jgi:hypothetical protein
MLIGIALLQGWRGVSLACASVTPLSCSGGTVKMGDSISVTAVRPWNIRC